MMMAAESLGLCPKPRDLALWALPIKKHKAAAGIAAALIVQRSTQRSGRFPALPYPLRER